MPERFSIFTGNAHPALAQAICDYLGVPLGRAEVFEFSNENIFVRIIDTVRSEDVFIIQPTCSPVSRSVLELLIMIDAMKRASAGRITAVLPYYAYARTDKKDQPRVPITARLLADCITVAGANRVLTMDLHAGQIQGFFNIPVDELTALFVLSNYFKRKRLPNVVVIAADVGIAKRARNFAEELNAPLAILEKRRIGNASRVEALNVIGEVEGKQAIIYDDEVDRRVDDRGGGDSAAAEARDLRHLHPRRSLRPRGEPHRQFAHPGDGYHRHHPAAGAQADSQHHQPHHSAPAGRGHPPDPQRHLYRRHVRSDASQGTRNMEQGTRG